MVPKEAIRSLHTLPQDLAQKLPLDMAIHGLLAADLALDKSCTPWNTLLPTYSDFESSVPFMWPGELQRLLPSQARELLAKQQEKFNQHWEMFNEAIPEVPQKDFLHAWFLVNTRTFYYETPETSLYPWEDRLALLPVADLFNHNETGCHVEFTSDWYSITADRTYESGEEVFTSYGEHSNDFLLAEYGFVLSENRWDNVCLDEVILPKLSRTQKQELERREVLGEYMLSYADGPCDRTKQVLKVLCGEEDKLERIRGKKDFHGEGVKTSETMLKEIAQQMLTMAREKLTAVQKTQTSSDSQRSTLVMRWVQIIKVLEKYM